MISVYLSSLLHLTMLGTTKLSFENDKEETCPKIGFHCLLKEISSSSVGLRQFVFNNTIYTHKEIIVIYFLLSRTDVRLSIAYTTLKVTSHVITEADIRSLSLINREQCVRIQFPFSVTWKQHVQADIDGNNQIRYSVPDWVSFSSHMNWPLKWSTKSSLHVKCMALITKHCEQLTFSLTLIPWER